MKVLWLCNVIIPAIAKEIGANPAVGGGWIQGAAEAVAENQNIQLHICFPQAKSAQMLMGQVTGVTFWGFPSSSKPMFVYDPETEAHLRNILNQVQPDVVHIWGTEFTQSLAMIRAFAKKDRTLVNVQGLCGFIAKHYTAHLPQKVCTAWTLRDFLRYDRIVEQQKKFRLRGAFEAETLQNAGMIIGRTNWDRACVRQLAPEAKYRVCKETLRDVFYEKAGRWSPDECERHSIFVSQAGYPLKGFHLVLEAMPEILRRYPDAKLYTTGRDLFAIPFYQVNGYQAWLKKQITKLGLRDKVCFLGRLDAASMCERFLLSHVFVSPSSIENSPNSVGEAMLLGVPTVASYVGGTMDLLRDKEDGFLYPSDAPYILADRVCAFFADDALAVRMGKCASDHAMITHDPENNLRCLLKIYEEIQSK